MKLRNGSTPNDPRLGRVPSFDERSRAFPVRSLLEPGLELRSRTWRCDPRLDQGQTPSCVGHAWAHDDAAAPIRRKVSGDLAMRWYALAQENDEWAGSSYEGSSTLGGAKAGVALGKFKEYRWCFSINDLLLAVSHLGTVVVGTNWRRRMFSPDARGLVHYEGVTDGGHEWLVRGVDLAREEFVARNSWSRFWGAEGDFRISFRDMGLAMSEGGDACFPGR
jgi:hypothetical protein